MPFGVPDFNALHIEQGLECFYKNDFETALSEFEQAQQIRDSAMARYNKAHALLALGRYREAWPLFTSRFEVYREALTLTETGHRLMKTLPRWNGEPWRRVVLLHEAGYGDTIMFLRFAQHIPADVVLDVPESLKALAAQCAPLGDDGEFWFSMFDLPGLVPDIPPPPYLAPDPTRVALWDSKMWDSKMWDSKMRDSKIAKGKRIGIAWSSNTNHNGEHENQTRSLELEQFLNLLPIQGEYFSLQYHDHESARAICRGVQTPDIQDFADVAALSSLMDVIVSVDTAALHVAGAIGHPNTYAILPWGKTWRWYAADRWYPKIKLCQAKAPGDWPSAFAQLENYHADEAA
jgi:tetratricopeptide (TPR) repeat protein